MKREQFLRLVKRLSKERGLDYDWIKGEGKGSHGTVYVGKEKQIVKHGELSKKYMRIVLKRLGLPPEAV